MPQVIIGIDVAKDTVETAFVSETRLIEQASYPNTKTGHRHLRATAI